MVKGNKSHYIKGKTELLWGNCEYAWQTALQEVVSLRERAHPA